MGAATAFYLTRAGMKVAVLEKRPALCTLTTPVATGAFRAQFDNPDEIALVRESIAAFENFGAHIGVDNYDIAIRQQGYLWLTTTQKGMARQRELVAAQHKWGLSDVELMSGDEARKHWEYLSPAVMQARFRQGDGWLDVKKVTMGFAASAALVHSEKKKASSGATFCVDTAVTGIDVEAGLVKAIQTSRGTIACETAVIAAGPFSGTVSAMAGLSLKFDLRIRQRLVIVEAPEIPQHAPMTIDEDTGAHWRPTGRGASVLLTDHSSPSGPPLEDVPTTAKTYFDLMNPESPTAVARLAPFWRKVWERNTDHWYLRGGQYTYTPDHRPYIGETQVRGLFMNSGYSGHGIMGSAGGSRLLADVMTGKISPKENPFRLGRKMKERVLDVL
jgi:sarcosine oxidase subunit beta